MKTLSVRPEKKQSLTRNNVALVGRQSIYDRELDIFGYEVLYRPSEKENAAPKVFDGDKATSEVMLNTFIDVGLENLVGSKRAFINVTEPFIDGSIDIPWPTESIVIEVLSKIKPTPKILQGLQALKSQGYVIALDDFVFDGAQKSLVPFADILKVDFKHIDSDSLKDHVENFKKISDIKLLAKKIETQEDFEWCKASGFDYFQGYFLERPVMIKGQTISPNKMAILQLINRLQTPDIDIDELEDLIRVDISLSYKILKYINSPGFHLGGEVTSIRQALMLLGLKNLKTWVSLIILSGMSDKPSDIIRKTLTRAKMCELIAEVIKQDNRADYFLVGMFSLLDVMLSQEMENVLESMPIRQVLKEALLNHRHKEGKVLRLVIAYEQGAWQNMRAGTITAHSLRKAYLASVHWSDDAMTGLTAS